MDWFHYTYLYTSFNRLRIDINNYQNDIRLYFMHVSFKSYF